MKVMNEPFLIDGRYRLDVELGAGAFGRVYKATQVVFGKTMRTVAMKLFTGGAVSAENVETMMADALVILNVLASLPDWEIRQHFLTIYDLGITREDSPRGYVAMEFVPGGSLERRITDLERFTPLGTFHYVHQIVRAMAFMHGEGYVHSDLKPANVLVFQGRGHDVIKIGDFGLAGRYLGPLSHGPRGGTLSYLPAEALMGLPTTPAGDVFAIGLMAYEMLTGKNPYNEVGKTLDRSRPDYATVLNRMHLDARTSSLAFTRDQFPELSSSSREFAAVAPFLEVINKMLASSPAVRYASAVSVLDDLNRISEGKKPLLADGAGSPAPPAAAAGKTEAGTPDGEFEYLIKTRDWPGAQRRASEILKRDPGQPLGYLLKSRVALAQAEHVTAGGGPAESAMPYLQAAVPPLQKGLDACVAESNRRMLREAIGHVYQLMGDHVTAGRYLAFGSRDR